MNEETPRNENDPMAPENDGAAPEPAAAAHTRGGSPTSSSAMDFGEVKPEDRTMGMLCHILGILTSFVGPLIIWLIKKEQSKFVDDQGKEALNWQITLIIAYIIGAATIVICVGAFISLAAFLVAIIFGILGGLEANKGNAYRYPFAIRLIK